MNKYIIDYGCGKAIFYTAAKDVKARFQTLAGTCFGIRKSIMFVRIFETLSDDRAYKDTIFEQLIFNGDCYVWREDGARKMISPFTDKEWDEDYCDECRLEDANAMNKNINEEYDSNQRKIMCDDCRCQHVCRFKEKYAQLQRAVDDLIVNVDGIEKLRDIPWIKYPNDLVCKHFIRIFGGNER